MLVSGGVWGDSRVGCEVDAGQWRCGMDAGCSGVVGEGFGRDWRSVAGRGECWDFCRRKEEENSGLSRSLSDSLNWRR